VTVVTVVSC